MSLSTFSSPEPPPPFPSLFTSNVNNRAVPTHQCMRTPSPHRLDFPSCLDPSRPPAATDPISLAFTPSTSQSSFLKLQATGCTTGICSIHHSTAALFMHLLVPLTDYFALRFSFLIQHGHGVAPLYRLAPRAYPLDAHWTMDGSQMGPSSPPLEKHLRAS